MNKQGLLILFSLFFFLNCFKSSSQVLQKNQPLTAILKVLEKRYSVSFSFADKTVENKVVTMPNIDLGLEKALELLNKTTGLVFKILNERFITITKPSKKNNVPIIRQLEEVIITKYLTSGITKLNDGSLTLKPENFGILPGLIEPDVLQTIQSLPGIFSVDESVSNINVRGGTHDQNLILWDGIKMYQSGHFFGLISAFNPYTTKQVNISKNGTSAKYGDGISSVIDMQLSNDINTSFTGGIGFNLINANGYAKIPISKKIELQISSRRSITDVITTPTYDQYFKRVFQDSDFTKNNDNNNNTISQNEDFSFYDITAKLLYDLSEKDKLRFHFLNVNNRLVYEEQSQIDNTTETLNSELSQKNSAYSITYQRDWNENFSTSVQTYVSNYDLDATNVDITNNQRLIQENKVIDGSLKLDLNYRFNNNYKINGGYQFSEIGISNLDDINNPNFRSFIRDVIRTNAAYGEWSFLSNNAKTRLKLGSRINMFNKVNTVLVEPRLSFSQRFFNVFRLELLGELKSQITSQIIDLQNDFLGIEKRRWTLANNNKSVINVEESGKLIYPIPILKSKQGSIGIHYNKNQLLISTEGYIKQVNGLTSRSQGFQNQYQFNNAIGSYKIQGIDFLINKSFKNTFSTWLSYSYSKNDYTFSLLNNGKSFPNNTDVRHAIAFAGTYTYNKFKFSLGFNWHSGKPTTIPSVENNSSNLNTTITYNAPNTSNLEDYLRLDTSATYSFNLSKTNKVFIGASIWNILDKKNILNRYYTLDSENTINTVENRSLGITPNVSFRILFD